MASTLADPRAFQRLRAFEAGDRLAIEEMAREVLESGEMFAYTEVEPVMDYWIGPGTQTVVAEGPTGSLLGTYALKPNQPGRGAHVANAGYMVHSQARGQGIGRALCAHSIELARATGYLAMQFNLVISTNAPAIQLWKEFGFRVVGELPRVFRHERLGLVDALVFYREL